MAPYLILCAAVMLFGLLFCERNPARKKDMFFLAVTSTALIIMAAIRATTVGVDFQPYLDYFYRVARGGIAFLTSTSNRYPLEFGYGFLNYLISLIGNTQFVFAFGIAFVCMALTALFLYRYSRSVWISMFVFISFGFFLYTMCTIRHQIAICIFMFALPFAQNKKIVPYMLIVLLSSTFHNSMLILIPLYFILWIPLNWKTLTVYTTSTFLFIIFSEPILLFVTKYIYQNYQVGSYYMQGRDFRTSFIPIVLFLGLYLLKKPLLEQNPKNLPLLNICMYTALLFCMTLKHFVFQRFALTLLPAAMLILPELLQALRPSPAKLDAVFAAKQAVNVASGGAKKQALQKYTQLNTELRDTRAMYYAGLGFMLVAGWLYLLFLLTANRLSLVPYLIQPK